MIFMYDVSTAAANMVWVYCYVELASKDMKFFVENYLTLERTTSHTRCHLDRLHWTFYLYYLGFYEINPILG